MILKRVTALLLVLILALGFAACGGGTGNPDSDESEVVAIVGGNRNVTMDDLREYVLISSLFMSDASYAQDEYMQYIMMQVQSEERINYAVILEYFDRKEVVPLQENYQDEVDEFVAYMKEQLGDYIDEAGLTEKGLADYYTAQLYIDAYISEIIGEIDDFEAEKQRYYDENPDQFEKGLELDAAHILVDTEEEANELKRQLDEGADFAELAKEHSNDGSGQTGGELGSFMEGRMVTEFWEGAKALQPGEISGPVQSQYGFHLIRLNSRVEASMPELAEVDTDVETYVIRNLYYDRIEALREEIGVEYLEMDEEDGGDSGEDLSGNDGSGGESDDGSLADPDGGEGADGADGDNAEADGSDEAGE